MDENSSSAVRSLSATAWGARPAVASRRPLEGDFIARKLARTEVIMCAAPEYLARLQAERSDLAKPDYLPRLHKELLQVIALASQTNRLAIALQVPTDDRYREPPA